jgi:predicted glycosyltransferase involved in capsule biosynthesis
MTRPKKETPRPCSAASKFSFVLVFSGQLPGYPISQVQVFTDFAPLVTMFQRLFGPIIHFTKRMFRVSNGFTNNFYGFGHSEVSFLQREQREVCQDAIRGLPTVLGFDSRCFNRINYTTSPRNFIQNF